MALTPNYFNRALTQETYNHKKLYDSNIYVVFAEQHFNLSLGNITQKFIFFIKQKGEQFGDALPAYTLSGNPLFRVYDNAGGIAINSIDIDNTDTHLGEWQYSFNALDFNKKGVYDGEIIIFDNTNESVIGKFKINVF